MTISREARLIFIPRIAQDFLQRIASFVEGNDARRQSDEQQWTRVAHTPMHTIF
jgi:hypothetical protein